MDLITSANNQQMKAVTALLKKAKERREQNSFVAEGPRMVFEAPKTWVKHVYVSEHFISNPENREQLERFCTGQKFGYDVVADPVLRAVSDTQTPQGILAVVGIPHYALEDLVTENCHLLILESIQDPGNLGTMIRTGEGAGASGIIMNRTTVDLFNPKTVRATMGSLYRMPFFITGNLSETISQLQGQGIHLYAAHLKGKVSYDEPDYTQPTGFLIGNEGNGLSDAIADQADTYIRIPMEGQVESLNAAISATLLMYECSRQRRNKA